MKSMIDRISLDNYHLTTVKIFRADGAADHHFVFLVVHIVRLLSKEVAKRDKNGILDDRRRNFTSNKVNSVTFMKIINF